MGGMLPMCKKCMTILLMLLSVSLYAQTFEEVDQKVSLYPEFTSLRDLGIRIQNDFNTDDLRIRAAFVWLAQHVAYDTKGEVGGNHTQKISYSNDKEKQEAIQDMVWVKINRSFRLRKGVCIDYSLMLNALFEQLGLPSKIITGVGKTEIKRLDAAPAYRNHSWNAVQLNGSWRLMDATWAAGYVDTKSHRFVRKYQDHYFFTDPADFARHHLPANKEWQLLDNPIDAVTFFQGPILLPGFCEKGIRLSSQTSGILTLSEEQENIIYFDQLPREHLMHYTIDDSTEFRRLGFKKGDGNGYISRIKLKKRFNRPYETLTVYMNLDPILSFRIQEELYQKVEAKSSK